MPFTPRSIVASMLFVSLFAACHRLAAAEETALATPKIAFAFTELRPSIEQMRFAFQCEDGLEVKARWVAQNVGKSAPPNYVIGTYQLVTKGPLNIISLSRPDNGWPLGLYRLELVHDGEIFRTEYYVIDEAQQKAT